MKLRKNTDFLGRGALEKAASRPAQRSGFVGFTVDDPDIVLARARDHPAQRRAGRLPHLRRLGLHGRARTSAYGYVRNPDGVSDDFLTSGRYELEVATVRVPAALHMGPLYDPANARVKA